MNEKNISERFEETIVFLIFFIIGTVIWRLIIGEGTLIFAENEYLDRDQLRLNINLFLYLILILALIIWYLSYSLIKLSRKVEFLKEEYNKSLVDGDSNNK